MESKEDKILSLTKVLVLAPAIIFHELGCTLTLIALSIIKLSLLSRSSKMMVAKCNCSKSTEHLHPTAVSGVSMSSRKERQLL